MLKSGRYLVGLVSRLTVLQETEYPCTSLPVYPETGKETNPKAVSPRATCKVEIPSRHSTMRLTNRRGPTIASGNRIRLPCMQGRLDLIDSSASPLPGYVSLCFLSSEPRILTIWRSQDLVLAFRPVWLRAARLPC